MAGNSMHAFNSSPWEAGADESPKFKPSQDYILGPCLKKLTKGAKKCTSIILCEC